MVCPLCCAPQHTVAWGQGRGHYTGCCNNLEGKEGTCSSARSSTGLWQKGTSGTIPPTLQRGT